MESGIDRLEKYLASRGKVAVALSGGLDSSVLVACAVAVLGAERCLALTACTPYMMHEEMEESRMLCLRLGVEHVCLEMEIPAGIADNPPNRCYLCKREVFERLKDMAFRRGFVCLADGTNHDDLSDYRPGMRALQELGIVNPFREADMGKAEIRELGRRLGLDAALIDKPAYACLLTRLEHDRPFTVEDLSRVDEAESWLRERGYSACRVRVHGKLARIELEPSACSSFWEDGTAGLADSVFRKLGFEFVTLDLRGYTRGGMNKIVPET